MGIWAQRLRKWLGRIVLGAAALAMALACACAVWITYDIYKSLNPPPENRHPFPHGLPPHEIVFAPENPYRWNPGAPTLGFLHPDGSGREIYRLFPLYEGARVMFFGRRPAPSHGIYPRWSPTGALVFSFHGTPPNIRRIDPDGRMVGQDCDTLYGGELAFDAQGNLLAPLYPYSHAYRKAPPEARPGVVWIARHDLQHCRIAGFLPLPIAIDPRFVGPIAENRAGWVAAEFPDFETHERKILLYHPTRGVRLVFPGSHPAFSDDGTWLAYYAPDGMLMVRPVEGGTARPLVRAFSPGKESSLEVYMPGWSPDGEWLVYNTPQGEIYKVHRESGQRVYLGPGWTPDWR